MAIIGVFIKENDSKVAKLSRELINKLKSKGNRSLSPTNKIISLSRNTTNEQFKRYNIEYIICVGGDGTMLLSSRLFSKFAVPLLGVNLGRRGFLTETEIANVPKIINKINSGDYFLDERMMMKIVIQRGKKTLNELYSLNDIVIGKNGIARIIRMEASINNRVMTNYAGDGLIISTPTGSTGHNLSANGPILDSKLSAMVMTSICSLSISNRSIVVGGDDKIKIKITEAPRGMEATVTADGQEVVPLKVGDVVTIEKADFRTTFIRIEDYNFFSVLKGKLGWEGE